METVTVTATLRGEKIQDVPLAVTTFNQDQLDAQGIVGMEGLARETPGVVLNQPSANFQSITARGISTNGYNANLQAPVAVYLDEVPISFVGNSTNLDPGLFDVDRVEFLSGPQGTLFGSGSLSGALRVLTKQPELDRFDASALVDFGYTEDAGSLRQRYNAMVNIPLIQDELALRIVGFDRNEGGYIDNIGTNTNNANRLVDYGGRAVLLWKPTERFSAKFLYSYEDSDPKDGGMYDPSLSDPADGKYVKDTPRPDLFTVRANTYNLTLDYQFDSANLTSSSTYMSQDKVFQVDLSRALGGAAPYALDLQYHEPVFVQEIRLVSDTGGSWDYVIGGYYQRRPASLQYNYLTEQSFLNEIGLTNPNGELVGLVNGTITQKEEAVFGDLTYHFNDQWWATVGLREGRVESTTDTVTYNSTYLPILLGLVPGAGGISVLPPVYSDIGVSANKLSYKASLSFKPVANLTTYATVSTGYRNPVANASGGQASLSNPNDIIIPLSAKSDSVTNYEIGSKGYWFDGQLSANVAAYYIDWENVQVQANRVSDAAQFATNLNQATSKGIEYDVKYTPNRDWSFGFNGSSIDAKVTELTPEQAAISGAIKGASLASPHFQASAFAQFNFDLDSAGTPGFVNLNIQHVGSHPNGFPFTPGEPGVPSPTFAKTDNYNLVNLSAGAHFDHWSVTVYAENLLNENAVTYVHPETFVYANTVGLRPCTVGVRFGYNY